VVVDDSEMLFDPPHPDRSDPRGFPFQSRTGLVIGVLISECAAFRIAGDEHRARRLGLDFIC
jgi:hypothetical protein